MFVTVLVIIHSLRCSNIFSPGLLQVILAPPSAGHKQVYTSALQFGRNDTNIKTFQQQGSSNLCGLCALNNASGEIVHTPAELDAIADQLWFEAIVDMGFKTELPPTRCRDGKEEHMKHKARTDAHPPGSGTFSIDCACSVYISQLISHTNVVLVIRLTFFFYMMTHKHTHTSYG